MSSKFQRPSGAYDGGSALSNRTKYQDDAAASPKRVIASAKVDGDFNYLIDAVNQTWDAVAGAAFSAVLPDQSGHAGCVPMTDGTVTTWQKVGNTTVVDASLSLGKMASITANSLVGSGSTGALAPVSVAGGLTLAAGVLSGAVIPPGLVLPFAGAVAPSGWLLCDGSAVSRTAYAALYAVLGTLYGAGDAVTTFNLPDMRGRLVLGLDNMGGTDASRLDIANTLGASGGSQLKSGSVDSHVLTVAEMPAHSHGMTNAGGAMVSSGSSGSSVAGQAPSTSAMTSTQNMTTLVGGGGGHAHTLTGFDVLPPYLLMNWLIKA